jgi:tRNA(Ile)-lysidine synthase
MLDRLTIERMLRWAGDKPVLIALSGGGDSVALLHLLVAEFGASRRAFAKALGVSADVLTLTWPDGANRAQEATRDARYLAICRHARALGLNTLVAAHTGDDQAETVLMRAAKGSTWRGLAGIAPFAFAPVWPEGRGIALARPLLGARREELRAYLRERGAAWIEDPANTNTAYERVRVRQRLAALRTAGFDLMRLERLAARLRRRSDALDCAALELIQHTAEVDLITHIRQAAWTGPRDARVRAFSVLMAAVSGASREPGWSDMDALEARLMNRDYRGSTHGGVEVARSKDSLALSRDAGAVLGRADGAPPLSALPLTKNVEAVWDGRLGVTAPEPGWRAIPARNSELVAFENGIVQKRYAEVRERFQLRPLTAERVAHAFAPDINLAKP